MHNEHYKKLKIDTISLWKSNKTLAQLIDACEFQIDKYNRRPKEGEETKDCDKIVFYSQLKKDCYILANTVGFGFTYNDAFDLVNEKKPNLCKEFLPNVFKNRNFFEKYEPIEVKKDDYVDSLSYALGHYNNKDLLKKNNDVYETQEGSTFRAILGNKIEIVGESDTDAEFQFVVARLNNGAEARLSKDLLETSHFKKINP